MIAVEQELRKRVTGKEKVEFLNVVNQYSK
jgi:hypothetical protein